MKKSRMVILSFFIMIMVVVAVWIGKIISGDLPLIDTWTRSLVETFPDTFIYTFFHGITNLGSQGFMYPFTAIVAIILIIMFRDWLPAVIFGLGIYATHKLNNLIKSFVDRDRPSFIEGVNAVGESFPSGHAMVSIVCYGLLAYFLAKKIKSATVVLFFQIFFALLVFLIGISRYIINVHYLTDVIAGFVFGFLCLVGLIFLYQLIVKARTRT